MKAMRLASVLLFAVLLAASSAAAQTARPRRDGKTAGRAAAKAPAQVGISQESRQGRWVGELISFDVKDADLRDVLHTLAQLTGLNIAVDPEVRGSVTMRLTDVPWDQALDLVLRVNGCGYLLEGNVLRVATVSKLSS